MVSCSPKVKLAGTIASSIGRISKVKLGAIKSLSLPALSKITRLAYIGNVGIAQEIDQLINFSKKISNLEITIVGDGAKLEELKKMCENENINNVLFSGVVHPSEVIKYMERADILFAQIGLKYSTAVPTKIFEYIASGRKVLLGLPKGPARTIFSEFHGVEIFDIGNRECFLESYNRLINSEFTEEGKKLNLGLLASHYLREDSVKKLVEAIECSRSVIMKSSKIIGLSEK